MLSNLLKFFDDFSKNRQTREKVIIKTFEKPKGFIAKKLSSSFPDPIEKLTNLIEELFYCCFLLNNCRLVLILQSFQLN